MSSANTLHKDTGRLYALGETHNAFRPNAPLHVSQFCWRSLVERSWEKMSYILLNIVAKARKCCDACGMHRLSCDVYSVKKSSEKRLCDIGIPLQFVNRLPSEILSRPKKT